MLLSFLSILFLSINIIAWNQRELVNRINSRNDIHWIAGINERTQNLTEEEFAQLGGAFSCSDDNSNNKKEISNPVRSNIKYEDLPESFDPRIKYPECSTIGRIYEQGKCGCCWAFCTGEAAQDRFCMQTHGLVQLHLSFEYITACEKKSLGCKGGYTSEALELMKREGIVSEDCMRYQAGTCVEDVCPNPKCQRQCSNPNISYNESKVHLSSAYRVFPLSDFKSDTLGGMEASIMAELLEFGPVTGIMNHYEDFSVYKGGVYHHVEGKLLGKHSMKIIGWGVWTEDDDKELLKKYEMKDSSIKNKRVETNVFSQDQKVNKVRNQNGTKYWIVVNSWGTKWGMNGVALIRRGEKAKAYGECDLEKEIWTGHPLIDERTRAMMKLEAEGKGQERERDRRKKLQFDFS
ncbi:putative cathepsin B [Monocercomonoides exilis]|uniref:putative cathepsin B n=1 Tax=Monocercomonoides exilis TaxID=2049356 RepID=UPI0035595394|nr:putative cathepsin B [Monocercomonoides exilis]